MNGDGRRLFAGTSLPDEAQRRTNEALRAIAEADVNDLLNRDLDVLLDEVLTPFERVTVRWDDVTMTEPVPTTTTATNVVGQPVSLQMASRTFAAPVDGDPAMLTWIGGTTAVCRPGPSLQIGTCNSWQTQRLARATSGGRCNGCQSRNPWLRQLPCHFRATAHSPTAGHTS